MHLDVLVATAGAEASASGCPDVRSILVNIPRWLINELHACKFLGAAMKYLTIVCMLITSAPCFA